MHKRPLVLPVIHVQTLERTLDNAALAFEAGCDGVFLISMDGHDELLVEMGVHVKDKWPDKKVGLNFLGEPVPEVAISRSAAAGLDMTWSDNAHVHTSQSLDRAVDISAELMRHPGHQFFGGVAFKYQRHEPSPGLAAVRAADLGFVPTTSGAGTGQAADPAKIEDMWCSLRGGDLAVASGITPDNVLDFSPYLSHILVSTGVSKNEYDFDFELLCQLMGKLSNTSVLEA